ncbi:MAG: PaaI family thioesterase [Clostridia bacterium]|nr:PaaI family thioesterase [Lachnospiraceae bacterium]NCB99344.1 PaaI family thioesterase [Clostridia bacterium]NCD01553.1 PaaI family thioesterase [Clostridia bacterium]
MKINKINLKNISNKVLFCDPENGKSEDFRISFSIDELKMDEAVRFGGEGLSSYHILLDGEARCSYGDERWQELSPIETCTCEEEEHMAVTGQGRFFNMIMAGGVRGFIRIVSMDDIFNMRVGEGVGDCRIALMGFDGGFQLDWDGNSVSCEEGDGLVLELKRQEFCQLKLIPEKKGMRLISASAVLLNPNDFGKYIGVHFLERGEGTCKARLEIRPEHMNPIGTVHGGCLFTLADAACGIAASSTGGICTTVTSNIQFLNAAFQPKYLTAVAKPKKLGHKIRNFLVEIRDDKEVLICTVDFVFYSLQK